MDAASCHALVRCFDNDADALRLQNVLNAIRNLSGQFFLHLKTASKCLDHARKFADADDLIFWQVTDVRFANNRRHMMFAMRFKRDITEYDHLVVAFDLFEGAFKVLDRVFAVAAKPVFISPRDAFGCIDEPFATGVLASPQQQSANRVLCLPATGFAGLSYFFLLGGHG